MRLFKNLHPPHTLTPPDHGNPAHVSVTTVSILLLIPLGMRGMAELHFADTLQTFDSRLLSFRKTRLLHAVPPLTSSSTMRLTLSLIPSISQR